MLLWAIRLVCRNAQRDGVAGALAGLLPGWGGVATPVGFAVCSNGVGRWLARRWRVQAEPWLWRMVGWFAVGWWALPGVADAAGSGRCGSMLAG